MYKPTLRVANRRGPAVLRFSTRLVGRANATKAGSSIVAPIPSAIDRKLGTMSLLEGTVNGHPFRAALESNSSNGRSLRVNQAMRKGAGAKPGDTVKIAVLGPEPAPIAPADLKKAFSASPEAMAMWKDIDTDGRRVWIRWIESAKTTETRARRVERAVDQLSDGKRRPCCVDVYEFMLSRIRE
ncbi:MAG TPA: YdeI/OmpD-associated family protein [Candidatus Eremiobacteraceae bacterium]|nr:YdeI/OmpD-associated family protein [Candidatus Eremiobacteraceae bacterium]